MNINRYLYVKDIAFLIRAFSVNDQKQFIRTIRVG
jgi:hypothetical protein